MTFRKDLSLPRMFSALKYYSKQSTVLPFMWRGEILSVCLTPPVGEEEGKPSVPPKSLKLGFLCYKFRPVLFKSSSAIWNWNNKHLCWHTQQRLWTGKWIELLLCCSTEAVLEVRQQELPFLQRCAFPALRSDTEVILITLIWARGNQEFVARAVPGGGQRLPLGRRDWRAEK